MTTREILLTVHILAAACWLGADVIVHLLAARTARESREVQTAWTRLEHWMHDRYYAVVAVVVLASGIWLVVDSPGIDRGSGFVWVGVAAIVGGATLGGGGLRTLASRRLAALEAGDDAAAAAVRRQMVRLGLVVTALPVVATVAMVTRWRA